jgi:hypothetical protein
MKNQDKSKTSLLKEIAGLKRQLKELKRTETDLMIEKGLYRTLDNSSQAGI